MIKIKLCLRNLDKQKKDDLLLQLYWILMLGIWGYFMTCKLFEFFFIKEYYYWLVETFMGYLMPKTSL